MMGTTMTSLSRLSGYQGYRCLQKLNIEPSASFKELLMTIDKFRDYLTEMRSIATDSTGREVLVGLTAEETDWYFAYTEKRMSDAPRGQNHGNDRARYLALHDRHERARFQVLGAEIEKRTDSPTSH
jgi:hypothetical protein